MSNVFKYRLVANDDGSRLAVQADEGAVTVIDVETNASGEVDPGGPMVGFADDALISLGQLSVPEGWPVIAFDAETLEGRILAEDLSSAQVVPGTDGDLVAMMRIDAIDVAKYEIHATSLRSGESWLVYAHDPVELGPMLRRKDRSYLGAELPPDWVLLADSFFTFIDGPEQAIKDRPLSSYPRLLNLRTGEWLRVGLFVERPP